MPNPSLNTAAADDMNNAASLQAPPRAARHFLKAAGFAGLAAAGACGASLGPLLLQETLPDLSLLFLPAGIALLFLGLGKAALTYAEGAGLRHAAHLHEDQESPLFKTEVVRAEQFFSDQSRPLPVPAAALYGAYGLQARCAPL
jgi:hypothetical protein